MLSIFLQAGGSAFGGLLPIVIIVLIMYLFFLRPQQKKQKQEKVYREELTKGQRIVTTSGIHGKILEVGDTFFIIESENSRLKVEKAAISMELSAQYNPKAETK